MSAQGAKKFNPDRKRFSPMSANPEISVITAVYNGEKHLEQCIESVQAQSFSNFEHIIVNDGSTDNTEKILEKWQKADPRVRVLKNEANKGRSLSRNRALTAARAPLVAVLDADDYSFPDRLETQYNLMKEYPETGALGGDMLIHGSGELLSHPKTDAEIRAQLFFDSALFHSTVMMRKSLLSETKSWYDPALPLAQDYGLWGSLMLSPKTVFANLPQALSAYRLEESPRPGYREKQISFANTVRARILEHIGLNPDKKTMAAHLSLLFENAAAFSCSPYDCVLHAKKLMAANDKRKLAAPEALQAQINRRLKNTLIYYKDPN